MTALTITLALVAVVAAALALVLLLTWRRALRRAVRRQDAADRELRELRERLGVLERRPVLPVRGHEYVITQLGELEPASAETTAVSLTAPAFADAVVRETVVHTASWVQGMRRALAPETRSRIRFAMKHEVKRSRKARKVEAKEALREYRARHRPAAADPTARPSVESAVEPGRGAA